MKNQPSEVCVIMPVYNGAKTIELAIKSLLCQTYTQWNCVIVNDGSKDNTKLVVEQYSNVQLISYSKNKGKTFAVMTGLSRAKGNIIMLLDADLLYLNDNDIENLILPVASGEVDVSISICQNSSLPYKMLGVDFESGQRVFHKKIIPDFEVLSQLPKYGLEVFLNNIIIKNKLKLKIINWDTVMAIRKSQKIGWWYGTYEEMKMTSQVVSTIPLSKLVFQIKHLRSLSVK